MADFSEMMGTATGSLEEIEGQRVMVANVTFADKEGTFGPFRETTIWLASDDGDEIGYVTASKVIADLMARYVAEVGEFPVGCTFYKKASKEGRTYWTIK